MALKKNIIYVYFKGKHLTTSKSQYQYNHGQFLYFADLDLPQAFEVHFSNEDKGYSKPKVGSNKLVEIPDEYFWSGASQIYAWVYLHSDTDDGETIYEVKIPLTKRARPTDEEPLPQQESAMERAIAELNNAVEITTENANKTEEDKTQVGNIRDEVVDLKENIDATAETVAQKSQDAIDASRRSEASAQNAAEFEDGARRYSEDSSQSANSASQSANQAKQYKNQSETNVTHYPKVINGYWYVWDAFNEEYVNTNVDARGEDGYSPTASVTKSGKTATVTITDKTGTTNAQVSDGTDGTDGVSPTVSIIPITGGHRIIITDADGEHSADVMDGTGSVDDVQINGTSIVSDGVANIPKATGNALGVVKVDYQYGVGFYGSSDFLAVSPASSTLIKSGTEGRRPVAPERQHESTFYGLAKSAGDTTQSQSSNAVGNYTDNAKDKIQTMLGVSPLIAPHESDPFESAHVIGELFIINGKLYRTKTALTAGEYVNEGTNVEVVDTSDVYVKNTDYATSNKAGIVKAGSGLQMQTGNYVDTLAIAKAREVDMKAGSDMYRPIVSQIQHTATFYGLAKASGDTTQSQSDNTVGTYTSEAKASIKSMLGVSDPVIITMTLTGNNIFYTPSMTFTEIMTALNQGKIVSVVDNNINYPYVGITTLDSITFIAFGVSTVYNNISTLYGFMIFEDNNTTNAMYVNQNTPIPDIQINGTSVVSNGVANIPKAGVDIYGVIKSNASYGISLNGSTGAPYIYKSSSNDIKTGEQLF